MCWKLKDFGITGRFLGESEEAYIGMNEAFAKGDRKYLEEICTPSMYAKLKGQLKDRVGRYEWKYHGLVEKPQIVSIRQGQIGGHVLIQMIVRLHSNQVSFFAHLMFSSTFQFTFSLWWRFSDLTILRLYTYAPSLVP